MVWYCYVWLAWSAFWCFMFTQAWKGTEKARNASDEINEKYRWFKQPNLDKWNYWSMLLQSFTLLPIRVAIFLVAFFGSGLVHLCLGEVGEQNWIKRKISSYSLWASCATILFVQGYALEAREEDFDYSQWLGPEWRNELKAFKKEKRVATNVCNHTSGIYDIFTMLTAKRGDVAFVASSFLKHVPCIGQSIDAGDGIYVDRDASRSELNKVVDTISKRQMAIESGKSNRKPITIFAEGLCTVGGIAKFKRGSFNSLCAVQPNVILQEPGLVYIGCYASSDHCPIIAGMCTLTRSKFKVISLPPFVPNDYLYNQRPDTPKWEVFADAVREVMLKRSGLKPSDATLPQVKDYIKLMQGKGTAPWTRDFTPNKTK